MVSSIYCNALDQGCVSGELTGLTWNDIDFENNTITVSRTLVYYDKGGKGKCGYAIHTPKTNAGNRVVPMIEKVRLALLEEQAYQKRIRD